MSACPVPYFSNLVADQTATTATTDNKKVEKQFVHNPTNQKLNGQTFFAPFLGLPSKKNSTLGRQRRLTEASVASKAVVGTKKNLLHIFPEQEKNTGNSILSQVTTPNIVEKQLVEINRPNFLNWATVNTVESLAKAAQKRIKQANPLNPNLGISKKRKKDIFDEY